MAKLTLEEITRQVTETRSRPLRKLPASWWEAKVAEQMSDYIVRHREQS